MSSAINFNYLYDMKIRIPPYAILGGGLCFLSLCFACTAVLTAPWQVWLVYGVMSGSAYGFINLNVFSVVVIRSVPKSRSSFAVGIATAGSTFGHFALVPLFRFMEYPTSDFVSFKHPVVLTTFTIPYFLFINLLYAHSLSF